LDGATRPHALVGAQRKLHTASRVLSTPKDAYYDLQEKSNC